MKARTCSSIAGTAWLIVAQSLVAGSYLNTAECTAIDGSPAPCVPGHPQSAPGNPINSFAVVHPRPFQQTGGAFQVRICVDSAVPGFQEVVEWALDLWSDLQPQTENCYRCRTLEDTISIGPATRTPVALALLHELGHCAMALDHPNMPWELFPGGPFSDRSFTRSWDDEDVNFGLDLIEGSFDDVHEGPPAEVSESVSWYRILDNDPIVVDGLVIDSDSFSRSIANLPFGDAWPANANRRVAEPLGHPTTQSVMYSQAATGQSFMGPSADDVNMVRMAQTGDDLQASTADDYTLDLVIVPCSGSFDVEIEFFAFGPGEGPGVFYTDVDYAYPQNPFLARVFKLVPNVGDSSLLVQLNSDVPWDFDIPIFGDSFSAGFTPWSVVQP